MYLCPDVRAFADKGLLFVLICKVFRYGAFSEIDRCMNKCFDRSMAVKLLGNCDRQTDQTSNCPIDGRTDWVIERFDFQKIDIERCIKKRVKER